MNTDFFSNVRGMDFVGQATSYTYYRLIITIAGIVGFIVGYIKQDFNATIFIVLAGTTVAFLICVPPWPYFKSHPLQWKDPDTLQTLDDKKKSRKGGSGGDAEPVSPNEGSKGKKKRR